MKNLLPALVLAIALVLPCSAQPAAAPASNSDVPEIVQKGFTAFQTGGPDMALSAWIKDSPLEMLGDARTNLYNTLSNAQNTYGTYTGWETVKVVQLSPSTRLVYAIAKYTKGPVWMCFSCFNAGTKWTIPTMTFDTDPTKVLPEQMRSGM